MKTIIIYASKYGCAADCAKYLKGRLSGDITLVDINNTDKLVEINAFDTVIIGGSVYAGRISKKLRDFCESNLTVLKQKRVGIFLCAAVSDNFQEYLKTNFSAQLLQTVKTVKLFGSEARLDKMRFMDKMILKAITKGDYSSFKIKHECMDEIVVELGL